MVMAKSLALAALLFLFFSAVSSNYVPCPPPPSKHHHHHHGPATCPSDTLKLGVCADVLGLININLGKPANTPCCGLLGGLADLEAAVCLCTAIKADILGIVLDIPLSITMLLNYCGKGVPAGYECA